MNGGEGATKCIWWCRWVWLKVFKIKVGNTWTTHNLIMVSEEKTKNIYFIVTTKLHFALCMGVLFFVLLYCIDLLKEYTNVKGHSIIWKSHNILVFYHLMLKISNCKSKICFSLLNNIVKSLIVCQHIFLSQWSHISMLLWPCHGWLMSGQAILLCRTLVSLQILCIIFYKTGDQTGEDSVM